MNHTQTTGTTPKKVYCEDCKFNPSYVSKYCDPDVKVGVRVDDYHGPRHLIRRMTLGSFERKKHNATNSCKGYKRKWWKFRRPK